MTDLYNKMKNKKYHSVGTVPKYHPVGIVPKYHPVGIVPKYHPVGIVPKYHPVGIVPKYHPVGIVPKSNCKFVERGNTQMNDISLCLLGTATSINNTCSFIIISGEQAAAYCQTILRHFLYYF